MLAIVPLLWGGDDTKTRARGKFLPLLSAIIYFMCRITSEGVLGPCEDVPPLSSARVSNKPQILSPTTCKAVVKCNLCLTFYKHQQNTKLISSTSFTGIPTLCGESFILKKKTWMGLSGMHKLWRVFTVGLFLHFQVRLSWPLQPRMPRQDLRLLFQVQQPKQEWRP